MSGINVRNILDEEAALITVTVLPGNGRSQRPVVVTVGIPEKKVIMRSGTFEQLQQIIDTAWGEYAKFEIAATPMPSGDDDDLLDETAVTDEEETQSTFSYDDDAF